jgi:hypothetical protein
MLIYLKGSVLGDPSPLLMARVWGSVFSVYKDLRSVLGDSSPLLMARVWGSVFSVYKDFVISGKFNFYKIYHLSTWIALSSSNEMVSFFTLNLGLCSLNSRDVIQPSCDYALLSLSPFDISIGFCSQNPIVNPNQLVPFNCNPNIHSPYPMSSISRYPFTLDATQPASLPSSPNLSSSITLDVDQPSSNPVAVTPPPVIFFVGFNSQNSTRNPNKTNHALTIFSRSTPQPNSLYLLVPNHSLNSFSPNTPDSCAPHNSNPNIHCPSSKKLSFPFHYSNQDNMCLISNDTNISTCPLSSKKN